MEPMVDLTHGSTRDAISDMVQLVAVASEGDLSRRLLASQLPQGAIQAACDSARRVEHSTGSSVQ